MSVHIDRKFLHMVSPKLRLFSRKKDDLYNFRCPVCGDSQKNKVKCRGYVYRKKNDYFFICHNCGASTTFYNFLKLVDPSLVQEYALERYRNGETGNQDYPKPEVVEVTNAKPVFAEKINLPSIKELPEGHFAKSYVEARSIPNHLYSSLYYAEDFKGFVESLGIEKDSLHTDDRRLVIPFYNEDKKLVMVQGRALGKSKLRYIAISVVEGFKFYGCDRMDRSSRVYVMEGPIDAMFIPNSIATGDSDLTRAGMLGLKDMVLVYDNEPRNKEIVKQVKHAIDAGFSVCLWPEIGEKDINDMIATGKTASEIKEVIDSNTHGGLRAKLEFSRWSKV